MKTETVTYKAGQTTCHGAFFFDETASGRRPGIVVLPDVRGVGPRANECHSRLVALGYAVLMADIYGDGTQMRDLPHGHALIGAVVADHDLWRGRIRAAVDALAAQPMVDAGRMAAIGYCFGGSTMLELAMSGAPVKAVVSFHGGLSWVDLADVADIRARVLFCTGAEDPLVPAADVVRMQEAFRAAKLTGWEVITYAGAKHSFTDPGAANTPATGYDKVAHERSWKAATDLLKECL